MIQVRRTAERGSFIFEVVVREGKGETRRHVTMSREMCERLTAGKHTPERCLEAAFRFLLDREPKESILGRFDVTAISRYFPEFEREMPRYFSIRRRPLPAGDQSKAVAGERLTRGRLRQPTRGHCRQVSDLHLWRVGPGHLAAFISLVSDHPNEPRFYKSRLSGLAGLSHVTIEVERCPGVHY
jgi:hypothetical protein